MVGPPLFGNGIERLVLLDLFNRLRDRVEHERMGRLASAFGSTGDPCLQVIFNTNGGGGHVGS